MSTAPIAAPYVAALAALIVSGRRGVTPFQIKVVLTATADPPPAEGD